MKKYLYFIIISFYPLVSFSQSVEVIGNLKVTEMEIENAENQLVVIQPDGTLAKRMVASLPSSEDTTRTLQSDLLVTSALCNCGNLPPAMIQSLLDNGYSLQNLIDFNVPPTDILASGYTIEELLNNGLSPID